MEMEEEGVTNRLIKRLGELLKEKETLAQAIDREEEFLTNTLQRKMLAVQREKVDVEQRLEAEQEYIVNKLQKQMVQVSKEKMYVDVALTKVSFCGGSDCDAWTRDGCHCRSMLV